MKPAVTRALITVSLGWMALSVWWPLWFLFFGALTPADELAAYLPQEYRTGVEDFGQQRPGILGHDFQMLRRNLVLQMFPAGGNSRTGERHLHHCSLPGEPAHDHRGRQRVEL